MSNWPQAVIFDFDGVIVHSEPLHYRAFAQVLATQGIELGEAEYYRQLLGFDDVGGFRHVFKLRGLPLESAQLKQLVEQKQQTMKQLMASGTFTALPGVKTFIARLVRHGVPMAICSGAIGSEIRTMLAGVGLAAHFQVIVAAEDVAVGKPDPRGYLKALHELSQRVDRTLRPEDCLIIEDAPTVIQTTRAVGFTLLGVASSHPLEQLSQAHWAVPSLEREALLSVAPRLSWLYNET